jgi:cytochrome b
MTSIETPVTSRVPVRTWDVPTRLVHWGFVLGVAGAWWTGENGRMEWHRWLGYGLLALVLFRLYWGFFGSSTARFGQFLRGPGAIGSYLRGRWEVAAGHNPLGALSVVALLALLGLQISLGLIAVDVDGIESGPLSVFVNFETGRAAAHWHERIFNALMVLVLLHIAAILYYRLVKKESLAAAMFHGTRVYPREVPPVQPASTLRLVIGIVIAAALTWAVTRAFGF